MASGGTASRFFWEGFVLSKKRKLLSPVARLSPASAGEPTPLPPAPSNPSLGAAGGFCRRCLGTGNFGATSRRAAASLPRAGGRRELGRGALARLCQSRFPASPKRGTGQPPGTSPCPPCLRFTPSPQLFPGCRRAVRAGGGSDRSAGGLSLPAVRGCACRARPQGMHP